MSSEPASSTHLSTSSPEFSQLEYRLQLDLKATTARILSASVVSNPHLSLQFEKASNVLTFEYVFLKLKSLLTLESWVDCSEQHGEEVVKSLQSNAFALPSTGMKFPVGHIHVDTSRNENNSQSSRFVKKVLFCKVAVGRAYLGDASNAPKDKIPAGYQSFYLPDLSNEDEYSHVYWVKSTSQVLPLYLVTFEYDPVKEKLSRERPRCDNCEKANAVVYCAADMAHLCADCDTTLHMASKVMQRHIRTPIGKGADIFGHCRTHTDQKIEFFCSQCHVPVCVHCKMVGNHSSGEASRHKLVSVTEAFDTVMKESQLNDSILETRKNKIQKQIAALRHRGKLVEQQQAQLESELEQLYRKALSDLRSKTETKLRILSGDEAEMKRQMGEMMHLDGFLSYQHGGDNGQLLFNWSKHQSIRQALHEMQHFRENIDVQLDLKIAGDVAIVVDERMSPVKSRMLPPKSMPAPSAPPVSNAASACNTVKATTVRRTSDVFAEVLNTLQISDGAAERASFVNDLDLDEHRSFTASLYNGKAK